MPKTKPGVPRISAEELRRTFNYDPDTGAFFRIVTCPAQRHRAGREAGTTNKRGRKTITINSRVYFAHRLAWLYVHGRWPSPAIDHINCNPSDNRIENLREATASQNLANRVLARVPLSGARGVYRRGRSFSCRLSIDGKQKHIGSFSSIEAAEDAYRAAKLARHGEFAKFE